MCFKYPWRDYQERVLSELSTHLDDDHLHVVAAPGSGKTILGLEVMRRINKPTVIFAPTLTIRNQWIERLRMMFLPKDEATAEINWLSTNLREPQFVTVITYQALYAVFSGQEAEIEEDDILFDVEGRAVQEKFDNRGDVVDVATLLKTAGIGTLVLDEAHHLRKEWWNVLMRVKEKLGEVQVVSLTATPPYDVDYSEWQKYQELCGEIDTEIAVPELVKQGDLCAHQDYIHFSRPQGQEVQQLSRYKEDLVEFLDALKKSEPFVDMFGVHPWIFDTENHVEEILSEPQFFSAMVIFLNAVEITPPQYALDILGISKQKIPPLTTLWLEVLFTGFLYTHRDAFEMFEADLKKIEKDLKQIGAIERRRVILDNTSQIKKLLARSLGKLDSIVEISRAESGQLGEQLRLVILADYIRKSEWPSDATEKKTICKIGVVPIFEYLRRENINGLRLGILTGSLVVIPVAAKQALLKAAAKEDILEKHIRLIPLVHDHNYFRVEISGKRRQKIVHLITEIFNKGHITTLIGTQSLLGEGWDAPSINSLILASYVGSYMLSNQMRGRAIRVNPKQPNKTANIWHLVALDIESFDEKLRRIFTGKTDRQQYFDAFDEIKEDLGYDLIKMRRRFRAFEGVTHQKPYVIENGFKRLALNDVSWTEDGIKNINQRMLAQASQRQKLPKIWNKALVGKNARPEMREKIESNRVPRSFIWLDTIKYLILNALLTSAAIASRMMPVSNNNSGNSFLIWMLFLALIGLVFAVPKLFKALRLWLRNGSLEGCMEQVGWVVVESLHKIRVIKTNPRNIKIKTVSDTYGLVYCRIEGVTNVESKYFLEAMDEVLSSIENPRYIVKRFNKLGPIQQIDYHAVPKLIGQKKETAEFFAKKWQRYVSNAALIYTRTPEGRLVLLKARTQSLSAAFQKKTDRISIWE